MYIQNNFETLQKSLPAQEPKAFMSDPFNMLDALQFKDRPYSLSYEILRHMSVKNAVVASIITTRVNQISTFTQPARFTDDGIGFKIRTRDPKHVATSEENSIMLAMELFLENCGFSFDSKRDGFDGFVRKLMRDSLTYDQACFEIVPDRKGRPAEIQAVDAATMRAASEKFSDLPGYEESTNSEKIQWVQVFNNSVQASFTAEEMAFGVRNPRTDVRLQPYGFSELEQLITQITSHLWAEEYNSRFFSQGGTTKGILNLKGKQMDTSLFEAFRRQWTAQVMGMTGAWKTPILNYDGELQYLSVNQSNREMEFEKWMNYLINIACAVFQMDPAEINFPNRGGVSGSGGGLSDGGIEDRLKNSKDKGLRPLLRFLESMINKHVIYRFDPRFVFNFVGIDVKTDSEILDIDGKEVKTFKTLNEKRKEKDLEPLPNGDIVLDTTYTSYLGIQQQNEMMQQQQGQMGEEVPEGEDGAIPDDEDNLYGMGDVDEESEGEGYNEMTEEDVEKSLTAPSMKVIRIIEN